MADLVLYENNDALVRFTLTQAGTSTPYDLTGATVELYLKDDPSQTDANARKKYSTATGEITVTDATNGKCQVQFAAADLATPRRYALHLDAIVAGKRVTLDARALVVTNV